MSVIEWKRERRRIILPALILPPYPITDLTGVEAKALLDTGSSVSGIASRLAETLKLVRLGKRPPTSAQGQGQVERYAFRVGLRPDQVASDTPAFPYVFEEVIGIELTNAFEFDALLGMDIRGQCDFEMLRDQRCASTSADERQGTGGFSGH